MDCILCITCARVTQEVGYSPLIEVEDTAEISDRVVWPPRCSSPWREWVGEEKVSFTLSFFFFFSIAATLRFQTARRLDVAVFSSSSLLPGFLVKNVLKSVSAVSLNLTSLRRSKLVTTWTTTREKCNAIVSLNLTSLRRCEHLQPELQTTKSATLMSDTSVSQFGRSVRYVWGWWTGALWFDSATLRLCFLLKRLWFADTRLVTLPRTINKTLKWLSSLPILMQNQSGVRCRQAHVHSLSLSLSLSLSQTPPPPTSRTSTMKLKLQKLEHHGVLFQLHVHNLIYNEWLNDL